MIEYWKETNKTVGGNYWWIWQFKTAKNCRVYGKIIKCYDGSDPRDQGIMWSTPKNYKETFINSKRNFEKLTDAEVFIELL